MSITDSRGLVFVCPENVNADVKVVIECREGRTGEYDFDLAPVEFRQPPRVLDIGANVGAFTLWASLKWPGCTVDAFEPNPEALRYLRQNVTTFDLRAIVHPVGVRASNGSALLRRGICGGETNLCCASFFDIGSQAEDGVEVAHIDAAELPDCQVLKIDTEGSEREIIPRYLATRRAPPKLVLVEIHSRTDRVLLESFLSESGYELYGGRIRMPNLGTFAFVAREIIAEKLRAR